MWVLVLRGLWSRVGLECCETALGKAIGGSKRRCEAGFHPGAELIPFGEARGEAETYSKSSCSSRF